MLNLNPNVRTLSAEQIAAEQQRYMVKVYGWMTAALAITGIIAMMTASSEAMIRTIFTNRGLFFGLLIGELLLVVAMSAAIGRLSALAATAMFVGYSALNGLTLASVFLLYTRGSIATTFFVTAGTFGGMSLYGTVTRRDLSSWRSFLMMGLWGIIIASIVNIFLGSEMLYWLVTYAGVLVFVGLTAYDTQKIRQFAVVGAAGSEEEQKGAIMGALILYLDFINLFLYLLRLLGRRR